MVVGKELMTFYADGRFYEGIPPSGAGPLDFEGLVAPGEPASATTPSLAESSSCVLPTVTFRA